MLFRELNRDKCKTYFVGCERTRTAALVDPVRERIDRYLGFLAYHRYVLEQVIDTHTHADHRTGTFDLHELTGANVVMHRKAPAPHVDVHVRDGDEIAVGDLRFRVLDTPGHTPDGISLYGEGRVLTGDVLFIRGTGRCDFAGGDPAAQYDAITGKLFVLPHETLVFPAHDYRGHTCSTVGEEKQLNPRVAGRTRAEYVDLMDHLGLPLPDKIQEVLQPNQSALDDTQVKFPTLPELNGVRQLSAMEVEALRVAANPPLLLDVRETEELAGDLGHVPGSVAIPLAELAARAGEIEERKHDAVVTICRAGVRSTTAAAILTGLGFDHVFNLRGGMVDWNDQGLRVER
jgi:glyoxylase-like metal-dependent hydrolase (beta-lactamase superfamily II)/rhodanese-related sulfurtransferase